MESFVRFPESELEVEQIHRQRAEAKSYGKALCSQRNNFKRTLSSLIPDKCDSFSLALDGCLTGYKWFLLLRGFSKDMWTPLSCDSALPVH